MALSLQHLWAEVLGRTAERFSFSMTCYAHLWKAEVSQLDVPSLVYKHVFGFQTESGKTMSQTSLVDGKLEFGYQVGRLTLCKECPSSVGAEVQGGYWQHKTLQRLTWSGQSGLSRKRAHHLGSTQGRSTACSQSRKRNPSWQWTRDGHFQECGAHQACVPISCASKSLPFSVFWEHTSSECPFSSLEALFHNFLFQLLWLSGSHEHWQFQFSPGNVGTFAPSS